jgi:holo-[acyl-carrier protein] synthase
VVGGGDGPPAVRLSGRAQARAAELGVEVEVSITHSKGMAGAVAMFR